MMRIAAMLMIARPAPSPSSPAPSARRHAAWGLDRSARPSKARNRAAKATLHCSGRTYTVVGQRPTGRVLVFSPHAPRLRFTPARPLGSSLGPPVYLQPLVCCGAFRPPSVQCLRHSYEPCWPARRARLMGIVDRPRASLPDRSPIDLRPAGRRSTCRYGAQILAASGCP
jgi:hypothetical protein